MVHKIGDKAIAKVGFHGFKIGEVITFQGMDYDYRDLECYVFTNSDGSSQDLVENEFRWKDN